MARLRDRQKPENLPVEVRQAVPGRRGRQTAGPMSTSASTFLGTISRSPQAEPTTVALRIRQDEVRVRARFDVVRRNALDLHIDNVDVLAHRLCIDRTFDTAGVSADRTSGTMAREPP
jgi:hypothetical protein